MDADDDQPKAAFVRTGQSHGQVDLPDAETSLEVAGVELGPAAVGRQPGAAQGPPLQVGDRDTAFSVGAQVELLIQPKGQSGIEGAAVAVQAVGAFDTVGLDQAQGALLTDEDLAGSSVHVLAQKASTALALQTT